ncbi:MAG: hypothetical protein Q9224_006382 [Gallowayella concinna]
MHSALVRVQNVFGFFTTVAFVTAIVVALSVTVIPQTPSAGIELRNVQVSHLSFQLEYEASIRLDNCNLPFEENFRTPFTSHHLGYNHRFPKPEEPLNPLHYVLESYEPPEDLYETKTTIQGEATGSRVGAWPSPAEKLQAKVSDYGYFGPAVLYRQRNT